MAVLIKGMEMPTNCEKCPFLDYEEGFCLASGVKGKSGWYESVLNPGSIKDGRHDDCPLVPVPDNGDLIERDMMHEMVNWEISKPPFSREKVRMMIDAAPTIIPANKEKEE